MNPAGGLLFWRKVGLCLSYFLCVAAARATTDVKALEGSRVVLTASVETGTAPFLYQWSKDGMTIAGAESASLVLDGVQLADAGTYVATVVNSGGAATSEPARIRVMPTNPARFTNFSVLSSGAGELTIGFALAAGNTSSVTPFLARAAGPSLGQFGVTGAVVDPALYLYSPNGLIAGNDDWDATAEGLLAATMKVNAFAFTAGSRDAATVAFLQPQSYTAQMKSRAGSPGVSLVELFDLEPESAHAAPRLVNLSALVAVDPQVQTATAGFTISGGAPVRVLVRAIGPSLAQFGVTGALPDPRLKLYRGNSVLVSNDNWASAGLQTITAAAGEVGAFKLPIDSRDASLLAVLQPGSYTVSLEGAPNSKGTALIEIYEVPWAW